MFIKARNVLLLLLTLFIPLYPKKSIPHLSLHISFKSPSHSTTEPFSSFKTLACLASLTRLRRDSITIAKAVFIFILRVSYCLL